MSPLLQIIALMREGQWTDAHALVQFDDSESAAWLHALLHVQEGDREDAEYWYGKAGHNFRSRGRMRWRRASEVSHRQQTSLERPARCSSTHRRSSSQARMNFYKAPGRG